MRTSQRRWLLLAGILLIILVGCSKKGEDQPSADVQAADKVALTFVQASVEGNDDLFKTILSPNEAHYKILVSGEHTWPGKYDELGERYSIYRYEKEPNDKGILHYQVAYYLANQDKKWVDRLEMKKEGDEWKVYEMRKQDFQREVPDVNSYTVIHEYKEGGS